MAKFRERERAVGQALGLVGMPHAYAVGHELGDAAYGPALGRQRARMAAHSARLRELITDSLIALSVAEDGGPDA